MNRKWLISICACLAFYFFMTPSFAAHPLISDDAGTQGKGKFLFELNGQYDWDQDDVNGSAFKFEGGQASASLSYGIVDNVDLVFGLPYLWGKIKENDATVYDEKGFGDASLDVKWRLLEKDKFSLALKPGITIPTGNDEKGLGAGRPGGRLFFIASRELGPFAVHANLGYIRNENKNEERKDLWHMSMAATWDVIATLKLVANIGIERNPASDTANDPAFVIGGILYSVTENFDVDLGVKCGLSRSETDFSLMTGIAYRF
jgi:hypothetical protein